MINDLTKNPPRSAAIRLGGYAILARTIDKCRSTILGKQGEYHYDCPVDKGLFEFKGINGNEFKSFVEKNKTDAEIVDWLNKSGKHKSQEEIMDWSDESCSNNPSLKDDEFGAWFSEECNKLNLNPKTTTLFHWLDVDDKASFVK
ncbi:MAG: DUF5069 domain-containing protein [Nanoarchaeota archaeon]